MLSLWSGIQPPNYNIAPVGKHDPFYDAVSRNITLVKIGACLYKCGSLFTKDVFLKSSINWISVKSFNTYQSVNTVKKPLTKNTFRKMKAHPYFICSEVFNLIHGELLATGRTNVYVEARLQFKWYFSWISNCTSHTLESRSVIAEAPVPDIFCSAMR